MPHILVDNILEENKSPSQSEEMKAESRNQSETAIDLEEIKISVDQPNMGTKTPNLQIRVESKGMNMESENSVQSKSSIFIEEADNLPPISSVGDFSPQKIASKIAAAASAPTAPLSILNPTKIGDAVSSPILSTSKEIVSKPQGKRFDIDSLNEVKRDVALQSKKLEITNQIFDMLLSEIKKDLFP